MKKNVYLSVKICIWLIIIMTVNASEVTLLYDESIKQYEHAVKVFEEKLSELEIKTRAYPFKPADEQTLEFGPKEFIFAIGSRAGNVAKRNQSRGVFILIPDPMELGLIGHQGQPLTALSGVVNCIKPEIKFKLIKSLLNKQDPTVAMVYNPEKNEYLAHSFKEEAPRWQVKLVTHQVFETDEVLHAFNQIEESHGVDCYLGVMDFTVFSSKTIDNLIRFSMINKVPLLGFASSFCKSGFLGAVYSDMEQMAWQAAKLVSRKINSDEAPTIEFLENFNYDINQASAKILRISLSDEVKADAKNVYG